MTRHPFRKRYLAFLAVPLLGIPLAARGKAPRPVSPGAEIVAVTTSSPDVATDLPEVSGASPSAAGACPSGMVMVEGQSCPNVKQECEDWIDDPVKYPYARCAKFKPSVCAAPGVAMRFCMDKEEYSAAGDELPTGDVSWTQAKAICENQGKRLCQEREWTFACEGEEMRPYPYGHQRDPNACNFEQGSLVTNDGKLRDGRVPASANQSCQSPFGVHNMVGNIDEWVVLDKPHYSEKNNGQKMISGLKGGWWGPLRNRCRPTTLDHDEVFHELQTGVRCCADPGGG
jgi:formylglycine-generating enzyme